MPRGVRDWDPALFLWWAAVRFPTGGVPSITTTFPKFGQFLAGNRFAEGKATKLSSAWSGRHEEVLKVPFLRTVVVILEVWPESHWPGFALRQADVFQSYTAW